MTLGIADINTIKRGDMGSKELHCELLTMTEYVEIAKRCIAHHASASQAQLMLDNEDAISFVAQALMQADMNWRPNGGRKRYSWRNHCAIFAIRSWMTQCKSKPNIRFDSLNVEFPNQDGESMPQLYERIADPNSLEPWETLEETETEERTNQEAHDLLNSEAITSTERDIIKMHFFEDKTVQEIGNALGFSRQRAHQILQRGLQKLRNA